MLFLGLRIYNTARRLDMGEAHNLLILNGLLTLYDVGKSIDREV